MNDDAATILVVDDEPDALGTVSTTLQRRGSTVLVADSGLQALSVLESRADVPLVLADCNMPGILRRELNKVILARWPQIKDNAMSGRPRDSELRDTIEFIHKPLRGANLIAVTESAFGRQTV